LVASKDNLDIKTLIVDLHKMFYDNFENNAHNFVNTVKADFLWNAHHIQRLGAGYVDSFKYLFTF